MRWVRRAATTGQVLVALVAVHLLGRDAVAAAVAFAPNARGVAHSSRAVPAELAAHVVRELGPTPSRPLALAGWMVEPHADRRPGTVLFLHGVRADRSLLSTYASSVLDAGYAALLVDLPGHGGSQGRFLGYGSAEARRVQAFLDDLRSDGVLGSEPLGVFGFSYGGAVAVELAAREPRVKAAVVVSSFASLRQVVSDYRAKYLPAPLTLLPESWFQGAVDEAAGIAGFDPDRGPLAAAPRTTIPILYVHGAADDQVPPKHSQELVRATPHGELLTVAGLTHEAAPHDGSGIIRRRAGEWFERWLR
jgi:pimeloyl-ACP methyl ester carboxylesterase